MENSATFHAARRGTGRLMTWRAVLGMSAALWMIAGCQSSDTAALDPEERQWVAEEREERLVPPTGGPMGAALPTPAQELERFDLSGYTPQGQKQWDVEGRSAELQGDTFHLQQVKGKSYGQEQEAAVTAARGTFNPTTRDVHLEKDVVATTSDGVVLKTDALDWSAASETMTTDAPLTMTKDNMEIQSTGGTAHTSMKEASFAEQVRVTIYPSTIITCDGALEVDYDHSKAVFRDNVHVTDERGELFADVMEVFFTAAHEIQQVIATGHVRIVRGEDTAYSDRAVYLQKEGKVFLTGQPKLVLFPGDDRKAALIGKPSAAP